MRFINVFVESEARVKVDKNNLVVETNERNVFPLEDVGVVMLDNHASTISVHALSRLIDYGAAVFVCDQKHLPTAYALPCNDYYKPIFNYELQQSISKPRKKSLWRELVRKKIANQADCLRRLGKPAERLYELSDSVLSGDSDNREGVAAAYYFSRLFGDDFTRGTDCDVNSTLNYGYAIVRGLIARNICARGFLPCLGVFHHNVFNAFNLADDLIEPFRPIVDFYAWHTVVANGLAFGAAVKREMFAVLNYDVFSGSEKHTLVNAVERFVESVIGFYAGKNDLIFPSICGMGFHDYE